MTPEHLPTRPVSALDEQQILDLLQDLRTTPAATRDADDATIAAIAELELEVARRGLEAPAVREHIPAAVALHRFRTACERGDFEAAGRAVFHMDAAGLWHAYLRAKEAGHIAVRLHLLDRIAFCIGYGVLGADRAHARRARLLQATNLSDEDLATYLVQYVDALLTISIINLDLPY